MTPRSATPNEASACQATAVEKDDNRGHHLLWLCTRWTNVHLCVFYIKSELDTLGLINYSERQRKWLV